MKEGDVALTGSRKDWAFVQASSVADYSARLRTADLRVTRPRIAVLHAVHTHPHSDTETVIRLVRDGLPDVSRQAVYDVLNALTSVGLLRRVQPSGSAGRYETRVGDNHHHVVCRTCGAIADVDCTAGEAPCLTAGAANGFEVDEAEVTFWGRCPDCGASDGSRANGAPDALARLHEEVSCPADNRPAPHRTDPALPTSPAAPDGWHSPVPLAAITVLKASGIGTGGLGANAGWARYDIADPTVAGKTPHTEPSTPRWGDVDVT